MPVTIGQSMTLVRNAMLKTVGTIDAKFNISRVVSQKFTDLANAMGPVVNRATTAMGPAFDAVASSLGAVKASVMGAWDAFSGFVAIEEQSGSGFNKLLDSVKPLLAELKSIAGVIDGVLSQSIKTLSGDLSTSQTAFGGLDSAMAVVATSLRGLRELATLIGKVFLFMADEALQGVQAMIHGFERVARFLHLDLADSLAGTSEALDMMRGNINAASQASDVHLASIIAEGQGLAQHTAATQADSQATVQHSDATASNTAIIDAETQAITKNKHGAGHELGGGRGRRPAQIGFGVRGQRRLGCLA